ncbi:MAG: plasmid pRiA4b ORF-3 family protein [Chloroflexi bacterium]|nr:plasmid pRiA4b ORF-3 family protein [Chloroflexota bacterium]
MLAELTAPTSVDDIVRRVLERYPATAKDPTKRVRDQLHSNDMVGVDLVYLDPKTIVPLRLAMPGICFRAPLGADEVESGLLHIQPSFIPFLIDRFNYITAKGGIEVRDENDQIISTGLVKVPLQTKTMWGDEVTREYDALDLRDWLRVHRARAKDSLRVTILNWRPARLRCEFEPQSAYRKNVFAAQDRALASCIQSLLDESYDERLHTSAAILTAYARMPGAHDYPGNHWYTVLFNDPRFFVTDFDIRPSLEAISTADFLREPFAEPESREQPFTREQGEMVYRFTAHENYGKRRCVIEILGKHTLADFDAVMRDAFDLDSFDHLSEFTRITRRGKGKKPREQPLGEINPFEPTAAMKRRLAGLGLDVGAELEYLYDFGDSLRHTLALQSICSVEQGVKYPRTVK